MFEIVTKETLPQFETFVEGHPKGHFLQSNLWAPVKPDWTWEGILSRNEAGEIRGAMSVLIRKMPGVPYKLMYAARGPVCDLNDRDALKDLTDGAAVLAKKYNAYALRIDPDVPSDQEGFIEPTKANVEDANAKGIAVDFFHMHGYHDWTFWRHCFYEFAQKVFR